MIEVIAFADFAVDHVQISGKRLGTLFQFA
jgi:hypothetical protein